MTEINLLESSIFNRIAAGEVVENPRSVIKELVENSIDANASFITVEIKNGGIDFIKVTDNGKGLLSQDLSLAFMPHATSKLKYISDLDNIKTLGFRGEALPSIASVAKTTMVSRKENYELGYKVVLVNGKIIEKEEVGCAIGTCVIVENLFEHIPARAKFLRKSSSEEGDVSDLISKIILANPNISIKYIIDEKIYYNSSGNGMESAIFTVYGNDILTNLTPISHTTPHITLSGYLCKPHFTKHNRNYQTLIVNGRYVINSEISYSIQQAYSNFLMKRQFPMYILYLNLPFDMVDVNVHPNKMDVKFVEYAKIKGIIYKEINKIIYAESLNPKNFGTVGDNDNLIVPSILIEPTNDAVYKAKDTQTSFQNNEQKTTPNNPTDFKPLSFLTSFSSCNSTVKENSKIKSKILENRLNSNSYAPLADDLSSCSVNSQQLEINNSVFESSDFILIGKIFNTYAIIQSANNMFLVDQHAAHEKILFDRLTKDIDNGNLAIQDLMIPFVFAVSHYEKPKLEDIVGDLQKIGVILTPLNGLNFSISAIPACCSSISIQIFVNNLLTLINSKDVKKTSDLLCEKLKSTACKSAVKGHDDLSKQELFYLISLMENERTSLYCPHGRPTIIKIPQTEIEKWFKR